MKKIEIETRREAKQKREQVALLFSRLHIS